MWEPRARGMAAGPRLLSASDFSTGSATPCLRTSDSDFFGLFAAEQVLKDSELSWEEINSGDVDGSGDGGMDGVYLFVNGVLIREDTDLSVFRGPISIDLQIIQAKRSAGFEEAALQRLRQSSHDLLDLTRAPRELSTTYNQAVIAAFELFQSTYRGFSSRLPSLRASYAYVTLGDEPNPNVVRQVEPIRAAVVNHFGGAEVEFAFIGARELLDLARRRPRTTYELEYTDAITGTQGYVCLVKLQKYYEFVTDEHGRLNKSIFDANVRDHQGDVAVNTGIRDTLDRPQGDDFWWLNNGVTIVTDRAVSSGRVLTLENPQIVNGLQTSVELVNHFSRGETEAEERSVLVRTVTPTDDAGYARIIRATNSQTSIPIASLKATDRIHRDIEGYLRPRGWYYERRKNQYKNEGRPMQQIVTIPHLAQAIMAILLGRPNDARARPSTLLKRDEDYERVFSSSYPLESFMVWQVVPD